MAQTHRNTGVHRKRMTAPAAPKNRGSKIDPIQRPIVRLMSSAPISPPRLIVRRREARLHHRPGSRNIGFDGNDDSGSSGSGRYGRCGAGGGSGVTSTT